MITGKQICCRGLLLGTALGLIAATTAAQAQEIKNFTVTTSVGPAPAASPAPAPASAPLPAVAAVPPSTCEQAGQAAEQSNGLPPGLLVAVGRAESGRWDAAAQRFSPWPWSADIDGTPRWYDSMAAAVSDIQAQNADGHHSIDVGCFQINLGWHPDAFATLQQAFDPVANANYAAAFLRGLNARLGSWPAAIVAYHSANPQLGNPYKDRVMAFWSETPTVLPAATPLQNQADQFGIHIWTPGNAGQTAVSSQTVATGPATSLPQIVMPGR
jgi:hypothetical protein